MLVFLADEMEGADFTEPNTHRPPVPEGHLGLSTKSFLEPIDMA